MNQGHDTDSYYEEQNGLPPYEGETSFATSGITGDPKKSMLSTVYLASENAAYTFNGESLDSGKPQGSYFGSQTSDVTDIFRRERILSSNTTTSLINFTKFSLPVSR